jgi:hypothetical protein
MELSLLMPWNLHFAFHVEGVAAKSWWRGRGTSKISRGDQRSLTCRFEKDGHMIIRLAIAVGVAVLLGGSASAEGYCDQVKQAVATYGYASARKHALENYGKEAVAFGDKCLGRGGGKHHRSTRRTRT